MVKLHIDELTKKITGFTSYPIEKGIDDYIIEEDFNIFDSLLEKDLYFIDDKLVIKEKDPDEYHNKLLQLQKNASEKEAYLDLSKILQKLIEENKPITDLNSAYNEIKNELDTLQKEINLLVKDHEEKTKECLRLRNKKLDESVNNKYYTSICLLIKDENEYLIEWIKWHISIGIQHFYIYDNGSEIPITDTIIELSREEKEKITVVDWSGHHDHMQHDCYNHCLKSYGEESAWVAFLDSDEFIRLTTDEKADINEFLHDYDEYGALYMLWIMYNANGRAHKEHLPVRERFTTVVEGHAELGFGKLFIKPSRTKQMRVHHVILKIGNETVNENFKTVIGTHYTPSYNKIAIDHYYTKSYEEWCNKIKRGSCDPKYHRKYDEFFMYNQDLGYLKDKNMQSEQEYQSFI